MLSVLMVQKIKQKNLNTSPHLQTQESYKRGVIWTLTLTSLMVVWHVASSFTPPYVLPPPILVFQTAFSDASLIKDQITVTMIQWIVGVGLSLVFGILLSVVCFFWKPIHSFLTPLLTMTQSIPTLAMAPLLLVWFGLGLTPKVILVFIACFFPVTHGLLSGLQQAQLRYSMISDMMRLGRWQSLRHVYGPAALPSLFMGLRVSASYAFVSSVMVELIGSEKGLGIYLTRAQSSYRTEAVILAVFLMMAISLATTGGLVLLERKWVFWKDQRL
jgi:putative hydroxymethylpyrimidine transport system permease protein